MINPPAAKKYCYWINSEKPATAEAWLADAKRHEGSWWTDWGRWLARKGGAQVVARTPGDGKLPVLEDAPGTYVLQRAGE